MRSSLYIGATGLKALGNGMQVIGNNLANSSTVGYKRTQAVFQDLISQNVYTDSNLKTNVSQKGMGAVLADNRRIFTQGGFEKTGMVTDMAISGKGFFGVSKDGKTHYTRAGNFHFTKEGALVDPNSFSLLGRRITPDGLSNQTEPIIINSNGESGVNYMFPKESSYITSISHLGGIDDKVKNPSNEFFGMTSQWDGTKSPALSKDNYGYSEPISYFDNLGNRQDATIYYDLVGKKNGHSILEYVVAIKPEEDASSRKDTKAAGLLMAGNISFNATGSLSNITGFAPPASNEPSDLANWLPAPLVDGYPAFNVHKEGAEPQDIGYNIGLKLQDSSTNGIANAADTLNNEKALLEKPAGAVLERQASTAYGNRPGNVFQQTDGYAKGYLKNISISESGIVSGAYSNNQSADLYQISVYRFLSQDGLKVVGKNHYESTPLSGPAEEGLPGTENFGKISAYYLEQSNVDYAREFSSMIINQRGFQMNSKVVTTTDQMLQKALELKR